MWTELEFSMQRHILMHMVSTYFNIEDVEKMSCCNWKRALKQTPIAECIVVLKQSCGSLKKFTYHKEKRQQNRLKQKQRKERKVRIAQRLIRRGFF
jgi:hypothetical protein